MRFFSQFVVDLKKELETLLAAYDDLAGQSFAFEAGESIHTKSLRKYDLSIW